MCRKVPKAMFTDSDHIALAGFLVDAGRMGEAPALAAEAAAVLPGISIQGWTWTSRLAESGQGAGHRAEACRRLPRLRESGRTRPRRGQAAIALFAADGRRPGRPTYGLK